MYLAEALNQRRDLLGRISHYKGLLPKMIYKIEGQDLAFEPEYVLQQLKNLASQLERVVRAINKTNHQTPLEDGKSLADAIAERDSIDLYISFCKKVMQGMNEVSCSYSDKEQTLRIDMKKVEEDLQRFLDQRRALDSEIQRINWQTVLVKV